MKSRIEKLEQQLAQRGLGQGSLKGWVPVYAFHFAPGLPPLSDSELAQAIEHARANGEQPHIIQRSARWLAAEDALLIAGEA